MPIDSSSPGTYTILLLGSGGREHAVAWGLSRSKSVERLVIAPGNPGMENLGQLVPVRIEDGVEVVELARSVEADLVVVGPEAPLAAGVADALRSHGFAVFGPSRSAARLEWDKAFSKDFMARHNIPTAASRTFGADEIAEAREYVSRHRLPVVVKASGLAAGKGVTIAATREEAEATVESMLGGKSFGDAGTTIVVEEFMRGEEASIFAVTDGERYVLLAPSQDHKRIGDGDTGPNTGGMGAYAPAPVVTSDVLNRIRTEIVEPTLDGMREDGMRYVGCLYVGVMIHDGAARVVEYNCRFGDPEAQVVIPLFTGDFADLLYAAATGRLDPSSVTVSAGNAACVVLASEGYPGAYTVGRRIEGLDDASALENVIVFHAGTHLDGPDLVTHGGRVLGVTAFSATEDLESVIARAYRAVDRVSYDGKYFRRDIGRRALERLAKQK